MGTHGGLKPKRASDALKRMAALGVVRRGTPSQLGWQRPNRSGTDPDWTYCLSNSWGYAVGVLAGHRGVGTGLIDARGEFREHGSTGPECRVDEAVAVGDGYNIGRRCRRSPTRSSSASSDVTLSWPS